MRFPFNCFFALCPDIFESTFLGIADLLGNFEFLAFLSPSGNVVQIKTNQANAEKLQQKISACVFDTRPKLKLTLWGGPKITLN